MKTKAVVLISLLIVGLLMTSCRGGETTPVDDGSSNQMDDTAMETSSEQTVTDTNTSGTEFEEAELPDEFPGNFPLPENTKVASTVPMPGDHSYRVFFSFPASSRWLFVALPWWRIPTPAAAAAPGGV